MPRNVRNFWLELDIDGRKSRVATGPVGRDGGFNMTILVRDQGDIKRAARITGRANDAGDLDLEIIPCEVDPARVENDGYVQIRTVR